MNALYLVCIRHCLFAVIALLSTQVSGQDQKNLFDEGVNGVLSKGFSDIDSNDTMRIERGKRLLRKDPKYHWSKGVVPYVYTETLINQFPEEMKEIKVAMSVYEYYTPIRFVHWTKTIHKELNLGHENYAIFTARSEHYSCSSHIGFQGHMKGQTINCCDRKICVHEIGHLLGFEHEHMHHDRDMWIRPDWGAIAGGGVKNQFPKLPVKPFLDLKYDLSSFMHYPQEKTFGGVTFSYNIPELRSVQRHFYMFKELCAVYKCHEYPQCKNHVLRCWNEGYVSVVNNYCLCVCPPGLDPYTRCTTVIKEGLSGGHTMPTGRYQFLKLGDHCPDGPYEDTTLSVSGQKQLQICSRTAKDCYSKSDCGWPKGTYCFIKHGKCPETVGVTKGELKFTRSPGSRIRFCCFENGFPEDPIRLPSTKPLTLFMKHHKECQQVIGMRAEKRHIDFFHTTMGNGPYSEGDDKKRQLYVCDYTLVDMNCGDIIELTDTKPTVTIESDKLRASNRDCTWLIKGSHEGGTLVLNFDEFDVNFENSKCIDTVEVKHSRIGQTGIKYCGKEVKHSIRSLFSKMMVRFQTGSSSTSHFKATITWKPDSELCYNSKDRGLSYRGKVNFTRRFEPCISWKDTSKCIHNSFSNRGEDHTVESTLEENFCRNPDKSFRPWCYTNLDGCKRDFCDVCHFEKAYDLAEDCSQFDCSKYPIETVKKCIATCGVTQKYSVQKVSEIKCTNPGNLVDGVLQNFKALYNVGEKAIYKCVLDNANRSLERMCLSNGQWSPANIACTECPIGFGPYKGHCYRYVQEMHTYDRAKEVCQKLGAEIASLKSEDENDYVTTLRYRPSEYLWVGGYLNNVTNTYFWEDGSAIEWDGFPENNKHMFRKEDETHITLGYWNGWVETVKMDRNAFVCKRDSYDNVTCADFQDNCLGLMDNKGDVTCDATPKYGNLSPFLKNICRYSCGLCSKDCGGLLELNKNHKTVTFETSMRNKDCSWIIKAPLNKGVLALYFDEFQVEARPDGICVDFMELRLSSIGKLGSMYCGKKIKKSFITTKNEIMVRFHPQANSKSHFKAIVKWIPDSEWCYKRDDKGQSYDGKVSYTEDFKPCISWKDAINCPHNPYQRGDLLANLEENYCRNPDDSSVPWCYIDKNTCQRQNCNVCHWGKPFDRSSDCAQRKKGFCNESPKKAMEECAATCSNNLILLVQRVSDITCDPPNPDSRGPMLGVAKAAYNVGDKVSFYCSSNSNNSIEKLQCLTSGRWAVAKTQCANCPVDYAGLNSKCYIYMNEGQSQPSASTFCKNMGALLAQPKTSQENAFLHKLRQKDDLMWIGASGVFSQGWKWGDGTQFTWTNWAYGMFVDCYHVRNLKTMTEM